MKNWVLNLVIVVILNSGCLAFESERQWPFRFRLHTLERSVGDACDPRDFWWYAVPGESHKFTYCHRISKKIVKDSCATVNGVQKIFDETLQQCVMPVAGEHKAPGLPRSSRFGDACVFNTDCLNNMYCPAGTCLCLPGFIDVDADCYPIVNPGQNGCISKRQCEAVWPSSECEDGVCQCPKPKIAVETRDGFVCVTAGSCPLPEDYETATQPAQLSKTVDTTDPQCVPNGGAAEDKEACYDSTANQSLADLYDCIPTNSNGDSGLCCPNRALTCILPKKTSTTQGSKTVTRYWFNSVTGSCEQFLWDPNYEISTANNFRTADQCRSYCQTACKRGAPEYSGPGKLGQPKTCSVNSECTRSRNSVTYQCSTVSTSHLCCPSTDWICSASGGRDYTPAQSPDPGSGSRTAVVRWYYDSSARSCRSFSYKGEGGNFNNFHTAEECNSFCARSLCERGDPLKDSSGNNQRCTGSRGCPSTYQCRQNVCCPRKQTICVQPRMIGTCTSALSRYWYNTATRDCEQFVYTGCNGNDNNFESYLICQNYCRDAKPEPKCIQGEADKDSNGNYYSCSLSGAGSNTCRLNYECYFDGYMFGCCPTKAWTCGLSRQTGTPCVASTVRWYFDSTSKSCQTFTYSGCDGNSNNFQTRQQCEQYCGVGGCPFGGEPYQDSNTMQRKVCSASGSPCPSGYECTNVVVGGNAVNYCCPTRAYICSQSANQGTQCGTTLQRYYFNMATKQCSTYTYLGCGGNENNFATLSQCNNFCSSAACAPGDSISLDANTQKPVACNVGVQTGCPPSYSCKMDKITGKSVCCGSSDLGVCPSRERAYIEALSQTARECQPGVAGACSPNYLCRANPAKNRYYCCAPDSNALCPAGKAPYRDLMTYQPQTCYVNSMTKGCPKGYFCQSSSAGGSQGFCCSAVGICPRNVEFYADPVSRKPRQCVYSKSSNNTQCPVGYACKPTVGDGFCCKLPSPPASAVCSGGKSVLEKGHPRSCTPGGECPNGSLCIPYSANGQSYCCWQESLKIAGQTTIKKDGCPPGASVLMVTGRPKTCDLGTEGSCPAGYSCQFNKDQNIYQCCGTGAVEKTSGKVKGSNVEADGCPLGQVAAFGVGSQRTMVCPGAGNRGCPTGYACVFSTRLGRNQCCGLNAGCRNGSVAFIDGSTGRPRECSRDDNCSSGFLCQSVHNGKSICCSSGRGNNAAVITAASPKLNENVCPAGVQLEDGHSSPTACSTWTDCPDGYECLPGKMGPVCCPSRKSVCSMSLQQGGSRCSDQVRQTERYFYHTSTGTCQKFTYSGCDGNDNNFKDVLTCDKYCAKSRCPKGEPARSGTSLRFCSDSDFCPFGYECIAPAYGSMERRICCPSKGSICASPSDKGSYCSDDGEISDSNGVSRFYYDNKSGKCRKFVYAGCGGNGNNFLTADECSTFCLSTTVEKTAYLPVGSGEASQCLLRGSRPYIPVRGSSPMRCRLGQRHTCPRGYSCQYHGVQSVFICCSVGLDRPSAPVAVHKGFCPSDSSVFQHPRTGQPRVCSTSAGCPSNFRCSLSPLWKHGFCCKRGSAWVAKGEANCPLDLSAYILADSGKPVQCALDGGVNFGTDVLSACPAGYSCAYSSNMRRYICCGRGTTNSSTGKPDWTAAPPGENITSTCKRGQPFIYPGTSMPLACPARRSALCPRGYSCELSVSKRQYVCCSQLVKGSARPSGQLLENGNNKMQVESNEQETTRTVDPSRSSPPTTATSTVEDIDGDYVDLESPIDCPMEAPMLDLTPLQCDSTERRRLGEECCADDQCVYGCRRHGNKRMCLCPRHMILDMTRKPYRCAFSCWAWRDGGTCIRHSPYSRSIARLGMIKSVRSL